MTVALKHVASGTGTTYNVIGGDQITIKAESSDTGGAFTVLETVTPPQAGPPPHLHKFEDESFYVLDGEFEFQIGDTVIAARTGSFVMAPRGVPHRFQNVGTTPGKLLVICQPGGFERFVIDFAALPPDEPPDYPQMSAIAERYGIEFVT